MTFEPQFHFSDYAVMVLYILGIVGLGFFFTKKGSDTKEYLLGGKSIPSWALGISMYVTLLSALTFVSVPEEAYAHGITLWLQAPIGLLFVPLAFWSFVAFYYAMGSFTPYEYIERRFSPSARVISSIIFLVQKGIYLALILFASAVAFEGAVGWDVTFTILLVGVLGVAYTIMGGFKAVVWTDVIQFFVLGGGILLVAVLASVKADGGPVGVLTYAVEHGRGFNLGRDFFSFNVYERLTIWWILLGSFGAIMNYYATDQLVIQRLLASKTYKDAKRSVWVKVPVMLGVGSLFWFTGLALFAYFNQAGAGDMEAFGISPRTALPYFISTKLPSPIPGLIMAGLLAAIMSTIDSAINSLSTVAIKDFYLRFVNPAASEDRQVYWSRWLTFIWGAYMISAALMINWVFKRTTTTILETSALWQSLGGMILGIYILAVTTRSLGAKGMIVAFIAALVIHIPSVLIFYYLKPVDQRVTFLVVGNIGLLATLAAGYIIAAFNRMRGNAPPPEKINGLTLWTIDRSGIDQPEPPAAPKEPL